MINGGMGVIFKGSGFYVTDKGSSSGKKAASTTCESCPKSDTACPAKEKAVG
jgi:predicted nucleic acid-binding Zn ribbon protein